MIDSILQRIAAGETIDPAHPELAAAFAAEPLRREFAARAIEFFELADRVDPSLDLVGMAASSEAGLAEFLQGLSFFVGMRESFEQGLTPSPGEVPAEHDARPPLVDLDAAAVEQALAATARAFFLSHRFGDEQSIEGDLFVLPNFEMATAKVRWSAAATATGPVEVVPSAPDDDNPFAGRIDSDGRAKSELRLASEPEEELVSAVGTLSLTVPTRFHRFAFDAADVGAARSDGPVTATLVSLQNDCVRVTIEGADGDATRAIVGLDGAGQRLRDRESQTQHGRGSWTSDVRFAGAPARIDVVVVAESIRRELEITATSEPQQNDDGTWPTPAAPRYVPPRPEAVFAELSAADLGTIEVVGGRTSAMFEFNANELHVHLPRCDNSMLASVELRDVCAEDADGEIVSEEAYGRGVTRALGCHRFYFQGAEEPDSVARMRGSVTVRYPLVLRRVIFTADSPEHGGLRAAFAGNVLRLMDGTDADPDASFGFSWTMDHATDEVPTMRVLDASGRELRQMPFRSWGSDGAELVFWGEPHTVHAWVVVEHATVEQAFDVPPAPPLDESLSGMDSSRIPCRGD